MKKLSNIDYLQKHQYKDDANLNARIRVHRQFSTNTYPWFWWVFDHFQMPPACRVLELGCGPGDLWAENAHRIPKGWEVTLSDFSMGMLQRAQEKLDHTPQQFVFRLIEAQNIPYPPESFHGIIANHMLYHVPNRRKALSEIKRVLKPKGRAYFATVGENHMSELLNLVAQFDPQLTHEHKIEKVNFTLENGAAQLSRYFSDVRCYRQENALHVTEVKPFVNYVLSSVKLGVTKNRKEAFTCFVTKELEANDSVLFINKENGMFEATK